MIVDFYEGAYGPTIRIDVTEAADLERLQALFQALAEGRSESTRLQDHLDVSFRDIGSLTLQVCEPRRSTRQTVFQVKARGAPIEEPGFLWVAPPEAWTTCAELLDPLLEEQSPGHQYLSDEGVDDALIVLAFREVTMPDA